MYASKSFWSGLLERSVSTFAQVILGAIGVAIANGAGILEINWKSAASVAAAATVAAVLKAFASPAETDRAVPTAEPSPGPRHLAG
jgi:hypothetical protein